MRVPETRYARSTDGLRLAYQEWGEGPRVLVVPGLLSNVELQWEHEFFVRINEMLGRHLHVAGFDKRGIGLSDRPDDSPTLEQRIGDMVAVMDALGWERASLLGVSEGGAMSQLFAATYPERVEKVLLHNTFVSPRYYGRVRAYVRDGDIPLPSNAEITDHFRLLADGWPDNADEMVGWMMPDQADNESFVRWVGRLQRLSASPRDFRRQIESVFTLDPGDSPERIVSPTLVLHVKGDRVLHVAMGRLLADLIPDAEYVEVDGPDHFSWALSSWRELIDPAIEFFTGDRPTRAVTRRFASVLFTDIVDSTRRSAEIGDTAWRVILEDHDRLARKLVDQHGGRVVKSTGDGLLVVFDSPSQGVECGVALCGQLRSIDVPIRAGVHAGEIEVHDDGDVSGIAVNLAARVEQHAADGELWASSTVRDMLLGGALAFDDRGEHALKGIDGTWRLFAVGA